MLSLRRVLCSRPFAAAGRPALYFVFYYLYVLLCVNPSLIYEANQITTWFPVDRRGVEFLDEVLTHPGGPARYATILLSEFYYHAWAGALIISAAAALLCAAAAALWQALEGRSLQFAQYLPAVLVAVLYSQYAHVLSACLSLAAAALVACVYVWLPVRRGAFRCALFLALSCALYYVAAEGYLVFAAVCIIVEAVKRRRILLGGACLVCAAVVPFAIGAVVLQMRVRDAVDSLIPARVALYWHTEALVVALYVFCPATALVAALRRKRPADQAPADVQTEDARRDGGPLRWLLGTGALVLLTAALGLLAWDRNSRALLRIEWCSRRRMWDQLLQAARAVPAERYTVLVQWEVNRALHHAGRLLDEMFAYPQSPYALMPTARSLGLGQSELPDTAYAKVSAVLFDLGRVNEAERRACEAMEFLGDRPDLIERMALIGVSKGQTEAARIWLGALKEDPVYRARATAYLGRLAAGPALSDDPQVQLIRSCRPVTDQVGGLTFEGMFTQLLEANRRNRMAAEYLIADHLLNGRLDKVASSVARLDDLGRPDVPRYLQEALLIYMTRTGLSVDLHGRTIGRDAAERYVAFDAAWARQRGDRWAVANALAADWGDTYFFYYYHSFGSSGRAR